MDKKFVNADLGRMEILYNQAHPDKPIKQADLKETVSHLMASPEFLIKFSEYMTPVVEQYLVEQAGIAIAAKEQKAAERAAKRAEKKTAVKDEGDPDAAVIENPQTEIVVN